MKVRKRVKNVTAAMGNYTLYKIRRVMKFGESNDFEKQPKRKKKYYCPNNG